jgi:hypothetical protein
MLSTEDCIARAKALMEDAEQAPYGPTRDLLKTMAETWLSVARLADWQDNHRLSPTHRTH